MPIHKVKGGYQWGNHGAVFPTREGAEKQAAAAYAHGYKGYAEGGEVTGNHMQEFHKKIIKHILDEEMQGAKHDAVNSILGHEEHDDEDKDESPIEEKAEETVHEPGEDHHEALDSPDVEDSDDDDDEETNRIVKAFLATRKAK